ncbi:coiled-coil and C2 domain-containing protein 2A [Lepeophtheirus salmonis]|uniref:coiled-coil and C2 domain-containing protein 2A n=1 Tax=Lepeophtheirus salmonis TaxID=72036 RepID=UPI003AF39566
MANNATQSTWLENESSSPEETLIKKTKNTKSKNLPPLNASSIQEKDETENKIKKVKKKRSKIKKDKKDTGGTEDPQSKIHEHKMKKNVQVEENNDNEDIESGGYSARNKRKNSILQKFGKRSTSIESHRSDVMNNKNNIIRSSQTSRYEDRFRHEDKSTQDAFAKHREKTKERFEKKGNGSPEISREEAYDFFTKVFIASSQNEEIPTVEDDQNGDNDHEGSNLEAEERSSQEGKDIQKMNVRDILGDKFDHKETVMSSPDIQGTTRSMSSCGLYFPGTKKVPMENKLDGNKQPFFPEEDGIYIGVRPVTVSRNQNKLEKRILTEKKGNLWFGPDRKLISNYESIQRRSSRPPTFDEFNPCIETFYTRPQSPSTLLPSNKRSYLQDTNCQLDLDIASIVFSHHHLFSIEHFLTKKIVEFYEEYKNNLTHRRDSAYDRKLEVLYATLDQINGETKSEDDFENFVEFKNRRIKTYKSEVASIRESRDSSESAERELIKKILTYWKYLRDFRKKQGYSLTSHRILIHKEKVSNPVNEHQRWAQEIDREVDDLQSEFELNKEELENEFTKKMNKWKDFHAAKKEARKRQKQREKDAEKGSGTAELADIAADEKIISTPDIEKPKPVTDFDWELVKKKVTENAFKCRKPPGEPRLYLELTQTQSTAGSTTTIGKEGIHDNREKIRQNAVSKTKISVRVYINGKEACHASPNSLTPEFTCQIGRIFPIQVLQWPETITIQIIEGTLLKSNVLAEVPVPLCDTSTTLESSQMEPITFKSDLKIIHDHLGLGSCIDFPINVDGSDIVSCKISGFIFVRLGWGKSRHGEVLCPPSSLWKPPRSASSLNDPLLEIMDGDGYVDPTKLENWIHKSRIDPNDPSNADLMNRVSEATLKKNFSKLYLNDERHTFDDLSSSNNYFRLDQHSDQFTFTTSDQIENNHRFQLFLLRKSKVPEFKNYKMIPASSKEVPHGLLEAREKRAAATRKDVIGSGNPLRSRSRLYLDKLRTQVSHRFSLVKHRKGHMDIVLEDPIPNAKSLLHMFGEMMPAQRPLRPVRMERQKVLIHDLSGQDIKISLSIVRAFDVPVRVDSESSHSSTSLKTSVSGSKEILRESKVNSFVEARFQGESVRTSSSPGPNPAWNQQLTLNFKSKNNDYSPDSLNKVNDALHLHLFDEIIVDLSPESSDDCEDQIYQRFERKWLGSMIIPFSSIYKNTRIEGTFRLYSPPILLGYERVNTIIGYSEGNNSDSREATFLNVYITIEPALAVPDQSIKEKLDCDEPDGIIELCEKWSKEIGKYHPNRKINPLVVDVSGKSILMTRYIKTLDPPTEIFSVEGGSTDNNSPEPADQVAWFVSLIPYVPSNALFPGLKNIWPTSNQVMNMMIGSEPEHAVLLTNYFLAMKKRAYLLLGQGIPEGYTAYVLSVEESGDRWLWNSISGERFRVTETFCPLIAVYAVLDDSNIWGNIQTCEHPSRLKWDFFSSSDWLPLFDRSMPNPQSPSVQSDSMVYTPSDPRAAKILKDKLERALRDSLMSLRPKLRTSMNFHGNAVLRKLLPGLEASRGGSAKERKNFLSDHLSELQRISASYKVCGFPLHFAFTEIEDVIKGLRSTGVYCNRDPNVEFALAVDVKPYPNTAMSVWLYIASLVKRS